MKRKVAEQNAAVIRRDLEGLDRAVLSQVMAALGRRGRGAAKRRGDSQYYRDLVNKRWLRRERE